MYIHTRPKPYQPRLEMLEDRFQPGSILFGAGSPLGSDLNERSDWDLTQDLVTSIHRLAHVNAASSLDPVTTHTGMTDPADPVRVSYAPISSGSVGTLTQQPAGLSLADQVLAANVANGRASDLQVRHPRHLGSGPSGTAGQRDASKPMAPVVVPPAHVSAQPLAAWAPRTTAPHAIANPHLTTTHRDQIQTRDATTNWASYLGTPGEDRLGGVGLDTSVDPTNPNIVVAGFTSAAGSRTLLLASFANDGRSATVGTLDLTGQFTNIEAFQVAVDSDGTIYVSASTTDTSGATGISLFQIDSGLTTASALTFNGTTSAAAGGVMLDGQGNLYAGGTMDGDVWVAKFADLANWPTPTQVYAQSLPFGVDGQPTPGTGADIVGDANGRAYLAVTFTVGAETHPGIVSFDGTTRNAQAYNSEGQNGFAYGVTLDAGNNPYLAFTYQNPSSNFTTLQVSRFDGNLNQTGAIGLDFQGVNARAYGVQVDQTDPANANAYVSRVAGDPQPGGGNLGFSKVNLTSLGGLLYDQGEALGSLDDRGRHLVLDSTNGTIDLVGATNSTDFSNTNGSFQDHNNGGYDGLVVQYGNV